MHKLVGLSGMRSLDQFKSLSGSASGAAKTSSISSRPSSDSVSYGSFANLKITAEKLVKEQASAKTDLELANSKMKKLTEHIHALEEKLQIAYNENAKLKVKQKEDEKLWKGLESKFSSTKTFCDQLTETLQHLAGKRELKELSIEKEEREKYFRDEQCKTTNVIEEKDAMIKHLEATVSATRLDMESLNSKMEELHVGLKFKEDDIQRLRISEEILEKEKSDLLSSNKRFSSKLDMALQQIKNLEDFANLVAAKLNELDKQSLTFSDKVVQLNSLYDSCFKLGQEEKYLASQCAKKQYDQLHNLSLHVTSEKDALQLVNQELNNKIIELQKDQEFSVVQHAEECHLAEERIRSLESDAESLLSKKSEMELLVTKSEEKIKTLSESSSLSESKMNLRAKILQKNCRRRYRKKAGEMDILQMEIDKHEQHVDSLEKQASQLQTILEEKEQHILRYKDREKQLEDQKTEVQASLADAESKLADAKKQYDLMLESKQLELSRHLKELSQKNDQAINDIRRRFEVEKLESVNIEKEKADKAVQEMESKCDQKLAECKEESRQYLMHIQEEQAALITRIKQEHDMKELNLKLNHSEELKFVQLQAENELREKTTLLRNEHEVQLKALKGQHEDECKKLKEELDAQKSKEDRQRALLQLQWKVMGDKPQEDQEVNSKKNYSTTSTKMRNSDGHRRSERAVVNVENEAKNSPYLRTTQTPISNLLKKVEKANTGSVMSIPKHSRKGPRKHTKIETPKANTPKDVLKGIKGGNPHPSNIGDLFSEGSLNPYADDPYAFD
ncbi:hypothetical protein HYC85_008155 [Camellia sinensis]|uniref:Synaptonemal complex protein 1 n=1 Tax=Camellia sinensis TaxID=4442 RepID=A0A7J7HRR3_CAMSI|nr:hypothetical protein HYC85_008155 [Camellia sinensis]